MWNQKLRRYQNPRFTGIDNFEPFAQAIGVRNASLSEISTIGKFNKLANASFCVIFQLFFAESGVVSVQNVNQGFVGIEKRRETILIGFQVPVYIWMRVKEQFW